jgi:lysophospholipase L1-like esterase
MIGILCFGDSITYGEGDNKGWCGRLKEWFESQNEDNGVYNLGVPGQTSAELLERFDKECKVRLRFKYPEDKYTTLIQIGTNDSKYDKKPPEGKETNTLEKFGSNIRTLIRKAKQHKHKFAFIGLPPTDDKKVNLRAWGSYFENDRVGEFNTILAENCKKEKIPFLDIHALMLEQEYKNMLADGLHPNAKGYEFMYKEIKKFLEKNNLLP